MSMITTTDGVNIFYKDWGSGQPIVFSHGWPLTADDWDAQMSFFLRHGYRVIAHDRRGHGRSDQPNTGNDMDTWVADLAALTDTSTCATRSISATPRVAVRWLAMSLATRSASRRRRWSLH